MQPDTSTTYLKQGQQLQREGLLTEAEVAYRQAIELNPIFYGSFRYLGEVLALEGKLDQAVEAYQRAKELNPKALWVHQGLGEVFLQLNKIEDAIACFQTAIQINPDFSWAYNGLGECWSWKGNRENAIAAYQKAVELNPDSETFQHNLEKVLAEQELVSEEEITDKVEDSLELGKTLTEQGDFEGALKYYRKACELNPNSFDAHYQLIVCLSQYTESKLTVLESDSELGKVILQELQESNTEIALSDLNDDAFLQALSEVSDQSFVRELYRAYLKREPEPGAAENWSHHIQNTSTRKGLITVFRNTPEFKNILSRYGEENVQKDIAIHWKLIKVSREHLPEKIACYQRCLELNPYSCDLYYEYGQTLHRAGRIDEAILDYQQAIKIGCDLVDKNRIEEAVKCYKKSLEILPERHEIYYDLAIKFVASGKINELLCCYDQVFKSSEKSFHLYHKLAVFLAKQNFMNEAVTSLERLSKIPRLSDVYESIWKGSNQLAIVDETNPSYTIKIGVQEVYEYFIQTSKYKVINMNSLNEEDNIALKLAGLSVFNLCVIADVGYFYDHIYAHKFGVYESIEPEKIKPPVLPYEKNIVETGYIYCVCPFSGEILRSNQSFLIPGSPREVFAYRFVGKEVFYLLTGCQRGDKIGIYIPNLDMLIKFWGEASLYVGTQNINHLKAYLVSCWSSVKSYLSSQSRKMTLVVGFHTNIGHHIWDELTGIEYLCKREIVDNYHVFVGGYEYFSIEPLFPEIPSNYITHYDDVIPHQDTYSVFKTIVENNHFVFRLGTGFMDDNLFNRIKRSSIQRCSQEFLKQVKEIQERHFPVILIQIRAHYRIWLNQVEGIASIINNLYLDYPNLAIVFDGWSLTGKEDASSGSWSAIEKEKKLMTEILDMIPSDLKVYSSIGSTVDETVAWTLNVDLHISPLGAGTTFTAWIAHKPGVLHAHTAGLAAWGTIYVNQRNYPIIETFQSQVLIPDDSVENFENFNYKCDWRTIYNEVIKIIKELRK
jgi:tetratricopeptide (TPR) repeat protein